jgi:tight adherence protein B
MILSLAAGLAAAAVPAVYSREKAASRKELLTMQFKDLLYSLAASFASGRQMHHALKDAYENLLMVYSEKTPMIVELKYMLRGIEQNRENEEALLADFAVRSKQEDIINFVDVYKACRTTGGDMEKVIADSTKVMMDKMEIEREIRALTAQKRFEGRIISLMPLIVVLFLNVFSPDYLAVMYETLSGRIVMTLSLAGIVIAYRMMMKLTDVVI